MFLYLYGDYFELYVPGKIDSLTSGENNLNTPVFLFIAAWLLSLPAGMIMITLTARHALAKWSNVGVAIFFTLFTLYAGLSAVSAWRAFYVYLSIAESIITAVIAYRSFRWTSAF